MYRVRKDWNDPSTQLAAFCLLENAKLFVDLAEEECYVFDEDGNRIYPE